MADPTYTVRHEIFMDGKETKTSGTYAAGANSWTFTTIRPFDTAVDMSTGEVLTLTTADHLTFSVTEVTNRSAHTIVFGRNFNCTVTLTRPYIRDENGQPYTIGEALVQSIVVGNKDTVEYTVSIERSQNRDSSDRYLDVAGVGSFGANKFKTSKTFVLCNAEDDELRVNLVNNTPRPSTWTSVEWDVTYSEPVR